MKRQRTASMVVGAGARWLRRARRLTSQESAWLHPLSFAAWSIADVAGSVAAMIDQRRTVRSFSPRADDIVIVSYPRSGTTWVQMILYQLTSDGEMDFEHICARSPWLERAVKNRRDLEHLPSPRVFKSHLPAEEMPAGAGSYIYVVRDPRDVAVSYYHHARRLQRFRGELDDFVEAFAAGAVKYGSWIDHVEGWWRARTTANILFVSYGELTRDLEGTIVRIALHCGLAFDPSRRGAITERCGFAFMKRHEHRFDPVAELFWEREYADRGEGAHTPFIRAGRDGGWRALLDQRQRDRLHRAFAERLAACEFPLQLADS